LPRKRFTAALAAALIATTFAAGADAQLPQLPQVPQVHVQASVAVTAPGPCGVTPAVAPVLQGGYGQFCGTSSATPLVAGLAGLILAAHPRTTNTRLAAAIEQTAKRAHTGVRFGRISAAAALAAAR
jgi:subtilisin family serine protease